MAKFAKASLTTKATDDAAAIVANEPAADMQLLNELIAKQVDEKTKKRKKSTKSYNRLCRN
jgi:hypothetical protein